MSITCDHEQMTKAVAEIRALIGVSGDSVSKLYLFKEINESLKPSFQGSAAAGYFSMVSVLYSKTDIAVLDLNVTLGKIAKFLEMAARDIRKVNDKIVKRLDIFLM